MITGVLGKIIHYKDNKKERLWGRSFLLANSYSFTLFSP